MVSHVKGTSVSLGSLPPPPPNAQKDVFSFSCPKTKAGCLHSGLRVWFSCDLEHKVSFAYLEVYPHSDC